MLEGFYTLCLMFENASWVDDYLQDGWKKQYVRLLLECEETKNLPRFNEFCTKRSARELWMRSDNFMGSRTPKFWA